MPSSHHPNGRPTRLSGEARIEDGREGFHPSSMGFDISGMNASSEWESFIRNHPLPLGRPAYTVRQATEGPVLNIPALGQADHHGVYNGGENSSDFLDPWPSDLSTFPSESFRPPPPSLGRQPDMRQATEGWAWPSDLSTFFGRQPDMRQATEGPVPNIPAQRQADHHGDLNGGENSSNFSADEELSEFLDFQNEPPRPPTPIVSGAHLPRCITLQETQPSDVVGRACSK